MSSKAPESTYYDSYYAPYDLASYEAGCGLRSRPRSSDHHACKADRSLFGHQRYGYNTHDTCSCSIQMQKLCSCNCNTMPSLFHKLVSAPYTKLTKKKTRVETKPAKQNAVAPVMRSIQVVSPPMLRVPVQQVSFTPQPVYARPLNIQMTYSNMPVTRVLHSQPAPVVIVPNPAVIRTVNQNNFLAPECAPQRASIVDKLNVENGPATVSFEEEINKCISVDQLMSREKIPRLATPEGSRLHVRQGDKKLQVVSKQINDRANALMSGLQQAGQVSRWEQNNHYSSTVSKVSFKAQSLAQEQKPSHRSPIQQIENSDQSFQI